jgi:hypothetical protein
MKNIPDCQRIGDLFNYRPKAKRCKQQAASSSQPRQRVGSWESMPNPKVKTMEPLGAEEEGGLMGGDGG